MIGACGTAGQSAGFRPQPVGPVERMSVEESSGHHEELGSAALAKAYGNVGPGTERPQSLLQICGACRRRRLESGDQFIQQRIEFFLLSNRESGQNAFLVGDMTAEPSTVCMPVSVSAINLPRRSLGSGRRSTSPARSSRSRRAVIPPDETTPFRPNIYLA